MSDNCLCHNTEYCGNLKYIMCNLKIINEYERLLHIYIIRI